MKKMTEDFNPDAVGLEEIAPPPELSLEELRMLKAFRAETERGSLVFLPRVKKYGSTITWEARIYLKGAMGPLRLTKEGIEAIDAPADWYEKGKLFQRSLQEKFPVLPSNPKSLPGE